MNYHILTNLYTMLLDQQFNEHLFLVTTDKYSLNSFEKIEEFITNSTKDHFDPLAYNFSLDSFAPNKIEYLKKKYFPINLIKDMCLVGYGNHSEKGKLIVIFCGVPIGSEKIGKSTLTDILNRILTCTVVFKHVLIIHANEITSPAKDALESYKNNFFFQLWPLHKLQKSLLKHSLMPKMKFFQDSEKKEFLTKKRVKQEFIPKLSQNDAVAKYFSAPLDSCILSEYNSIYGYHFNFRSVVEENLKKGKLKKPVKKKGS